MSSKKTKTKATKEHPQSATFNVFAMSEQSQIQEFKEVFNRIDQNRDGFIDKEAISTGTIQEDYLRDLLTTMGEWFTDEEVDELYREASIDKKGNFNYIEFTCILK
ncbi:myosin regulatory light chain RLC-A-like [Carlito syrichta]|uniref:EF-hand calcium-binding domain-containing protein 11 n=1 Tax=Carlito syrichta TaxID=1868482 RepID=A0A3Q0DJC8_CARSF|nr:myosin regulatory light chain RLC-A-like [Carlito syrichta]